jgi:isoleucyl-tRNA synthetase
MMDKYGADALRFWMYSINQPGESKNFDEKTVDEIIKKVFNLAANVASFYKMYAGEGSKSREIRDTRESQNILDRWIIARLDQVIENATANLDKYVLLEPTRAIRDFIADLSQWYLRRSRDRFKEEGSDKQAALATTKYVLLTLTKVMAPFTPFFAEELYQDVGGEKESVHLEDWPVGGKVDSKLLKDMEMVRSVASKGFEARMTAKLNVRQPLASLKVKLESVSVLDAELVELIKDEVNVKNVEFVASLEKDVALDTTITPVLKEEGDLRELLRKIQDLRKEKGLKVGDRASLIVPAELKSITDKYGSEIKKATGLVSIEIGIELMVK